MPTHQCSATSQFLIRCLPGQTAVETASYTTVVVYRPRHPSALPAVGLKPSALVRKGRLRSLDETA
jgi:hypothetical protein